MFSDSPTFSRVFWSAVHAEFSLGDMFYGNVPYGLFAWSGENSALGFYVIPRTTRWRRTPPRSENSNLAGNRRYILSRYECDYFSVIRFRFGRYKCD